jgi:hypothetical protein
MEDCPCLDKILIVDEITALVHYASERGLDPEGKLLVPLTDALSIYTRKNTPVPEKCNSARTVLQFYTKLAKLTYPVNGHTLIETQSIRYYLSWPIIYAILFLALALGNEILKGWFLKIGAPEEELYRSLFNIQHYVLEPLSPFFWGGLGACVYLLKRLTDFAADMSFDSKQLQGWQTRIWLGAILGAVAFQYIYPESAKLSADDMKFSAKPVAFLTGVGVRVIYGALEKLIDFLAVKLDISPPKKETPEPVISNSPLR